MIKYLYNCNYCGKDYIPKRRNKQKYCCNSCRVNAYNQRKKIKKEIEKLGSDNHESSKGDSINMAGIGNATIGTAAYDLGKRIFTPSEKKPVTQKDLSELIERLEERFHPVHNAPKRNDGTYAFYDKKTKEVKYLKLKQ